MLPTLYFSREGFSKYLGNNKTLLDYLADLKTAVVTLSETATDADGEAVDLTAILARLTALEAAVALAQATADQAPLWIPPQLSADDVRAITDRELLTEDGDYLLTEAGDRILLEAA